MSKNDVGVDIDLLEQQVSTLLRLFDRIDVVIGRTQVVRSNQDSATWSTMPAAQDFAAVYRAEITQLETEFATLRERVELIRDNLRLSASAQARTDDEVQGQLERFDPKPSTTPYFPPGYPGPVAPGADPVSPWRPSGSGDDFR
ncbi:hypothetical protein [Cellulomonas palmilytica]|uniref:hypothetical protein n=1 Tax=Cellulomonas palmilytica TaxID=2608402 RepID=UPI001F3D1C15|nr:hypothetical protein [Cellulomonas palmilytica]UJP39877.1 hypothetical protein F1D97_16590 [Cellulomonas palmilytica]